MEFSPMLTFHCELVPSCVGFWLASQLSTSIRSNF